MSKEPKKGEMQKCLDGWFERYCDDIDDANLERHKQICQAIRRLIENQPPIKKSLMKLAEDLGVSFSAAKIISDHAQPEVDGEFIERWQSILECSHKSRIDKIRQMLKEIPVRVKEKERI